MKLFRAFSAALALAFCLTMPAGAFTYSTALKNTRMDAVTTAIGSGGKLKFICADGTTVAATLTLSSPAAPAASSGVLTFNSITSGTAGATCTVNAAKITTSADVDVVTGLTVGTSGANINLGSVSFSPGLTVSVSSFTLTHG